MAQDSSNLKSYFKENLKNSFGKPYNIQTSETAVENGVGEKDTNEGRKRISIITGLIITLGSVATGTVFGYPSPATPDIDANRNPFHLSDEQSSWVGSIITLGGMAGGLLGGPYMDKIGRKMSSMSILIPFAIGWLIVIVSPNYACLLVGRFITGFCTGFLLIICPVYTSEIAPPSIRGLMGSYAQFGMTLGILYSYVAGAFLHWQWEAIACAAILPVMMFAVGFLPESPRWLMSVQRKDSALESLQWLRGKGIDVTHEMLKIEEMIHQSRNKASLREFLQPQLWKPLLITLGLMIFQQCSGINVVMFYTVDIFKMAKSTLDPNVETIVVGSVGVVGTLVSVLIADLVGRRILLLVSAVLMTISMGGLGAFFYVFESNAPFATGTLYWLPLVCLVVFNFGFNVAFGPIPWVMMGELFPVRAKGVASSIATVVNRLFAFIMSKFFVNITQVIHVYGGYWLCCAFSAVAIPFVIFCVPETKGKSLEEIEQKFSKG